MKKLLPWLAGLLVVFAIYLYTSPYIALNNIKNAAVQGDADKLSGYIDFPNVKQSMKDQVKAAMLKELAASDEQDGFEALGTMLATAMIDPIIDSVVTPDGVALMLQGQKLDFDLNNDTSEDKPEAKNEDIDYKAGYLSFNRFKVQIFDDVDKESLDVIMHRDGLSWKVTRIAFPLDLNDKESNNTVEEPSVADLDWADVEDEIYNTENDEFEDVFHGIVDSEEVADTGNSNIDTDGFYDEDDYNNGTGAHAVQTTGPLTPAQAARIDYLVDNDIETSQDMIDLLNDFTLDGSQEGELRKFIIERSRYDDGYDGLKDCRNPDLTEAEYMNNCT